MKPIRRLSRPQAAKPTVGVIPATRLQTDPDARMVRWGWLIWAATLVAMVLALRQGLHPAAYPPLAVPAALLLLWLLWRVGAWLWQLGREQVHGPWQGITFAFADSRIRVLNDPTQGLLFVADDVFDLFELHGRDRDPSRVRLMTGADGLLTAATASRARATHAPTVSPATTPATIVGLTRQTCFTVAGLQAWLARRTDRRALAFARWVEREVLAPHQRARDRLAADSSTAASAGKD